MGLRWNQDHEDRHRYLVRIPGNGRTWWVFVLAGGLAIVTAVLFAGEKNLSAVWSLQGEQRELQAMIQSQKLENQQFKRQIQDLQKDPKAVEWIARQELGMVRPDELVYRFVPASQDAANSKSAGTRSAGR